MLVNTRTGTYEARSSLSLIDENQNGPPDRDHREPKHKQIDITFV